MSDLPATACLDDFDAAAKPDFTAAPMRGFSPGWWIVPILISVLPVWAMLIQLCLSVFRP